VIVGFTAPRRSRKYLGALGIALRDGKQWRYSGHVGTGWTDARCCRTVERVQLRGSRTRDALVDLAQGKLFRTRQKYNRGV
jgi:ATP-dependent DNA ligase